MKIAVTCTHLQRDIDDYREEIAACGFELALPEIAGQELEGTALIAAMEGIEGVIAGDDKFTRQVLEHYQTFVRSLSGASA